ncbi:unnamed protein product [Candidula unifasciata]|uniref:Dermatopontin n=1 Tax=Candidula unifasciata TaxID=100452 RepID=A0A8S3YG94_9EUPU|nr:unnamed protein product [Candidula unifasciata]
MLSSARVCLLVFVMGWTKVDCGFVNDYDKDARLECLTNSILSYIGSIHENKYEDRIWEFACRPAPDTISGCYWTNYLNQFDKPLDYKCRGNEVLNGMMSYHDNRCEDRRFMVQCGRVANRSTRNCYQTFYVNDLDGVMTFSVPTGQVIKGVYSYHENKKEDRRWRFYLCDLA